MAKQAGKQTETAPDAILKTQQFDCLPLIIRRLKHVFGEFTGTPHGEWKEIIRFLSVHTGVAGGALFMYIEACHVNLDWLRGRDGAANNISTTAMVMSQWDISGGRELFLEFLKARWPDHNYYDGIGWNVKDIATTLDRLT